MTLSMAELTALLGGYFYPFIRIGAMLMAAPVFGARNTVFVLHRLGLALALTIIAQPYIGAVPVVEPFSSAGILIMINELILGVAMGFMLQLVFGALVIAGHSIAMTMGLGFASFVDPTNGLTIPVISKFYIVIATLLFLAMNGHLVTIQVLVESFNSIPVTTKSIVTQDFLAITLWGSKMYAGALLIAIPCMITITLINIGFGVMTRTAPQMNIFAVGFPTTLTAGIVVIMLTLPNLLPRFTDMLMDAFNLIQNNLLSM